ncbi:MAG: hypothetical protein HQL03_00705 [Nitrospirae bacterium]|nr:hypothetical protein [Nitrospirota bacterium]
MNAVVPYNTFKDAKKDAKRAELVASLRNNLKDTVDEFKREIDNLHIENNDHLLERLRGIEGFDHTLQSANTQQGVQEAVVRFGQQYSALKSEIELIKVEQRQARKAVDKPAHEITSVSAINIIQTIDTSQLREDLYIRDSNPANNTNVQQGREAIVAEARQFYNRIKDLDEQYCHDLTPLIKELDDCPYPQRLQLIRTTMKLHYGQIKELTAYTNHFRDMLERLLHHASLYDGLADVSPTIEALLSQRYISKEQYNSGVALLTDFVIGAQGRASRQGLIRQLRDNIESLGYTLATGDKTDSSDVEALASDLLLRIEKEQVVYLDTQWNGYKVMLKLNKDAELTTRLVRVVQRQQESQDITTNQRQRDMEIARKWCEDYDRFIEKLQQDHLFLGIRLRKEPQEQGILYVVGKEQETVQYAQRKEKEKEGGSA